MASDAKDENSPLVPKAAPPQKTPLVKLAAASCLLLAVGTGAGMLCEGWRFQTALYVTIQIVTTIGYGDFTVTTDQMKLFCAFYVVLVLVLAAYALNIGVERINTRNAEFFIEHIRADAKIMAELVTLPSSVEGGGPTPHTHRLRQFFERNGKIIGTSVLALSFVLFGTTFYAIYENCTCSYGRSHVAGCVDASYEQCRSTGGYVKTWTSAFYMSVITLTTVGFGDNTPRSSVGRLVAVPWMLLGVAAVAGWLTELQHFFFEHETKKRHAEADHTTHKEHVAIASAGDASHLTRSEYRCYMLLKLGLVSKHHMKEIDSHFDLLQKSPDGASVGVSLEDVLKFHRRHCEGLPV